MACMPMPLGLDTATCDHDQRQLSQVSLNDFIVRAVALALAEVPAANASWDVGASAPKHGQGVDIAIAVATDKGLITPIVKGADKKSLTQVRATPPARSGFQPLRWPGRMRLLQDVMHQVRLAAFTSAQHPRDSTPHQQLLTGWVPPLQISSEVRDLAQRARANKLKPDEFQGGSFSISNLGMFGIDFFSAIINSPQACPPPLTPKLPSTVMLSGCCAMGLQQCS